MKKLIYILFLALGNFLFSQYMIVGKDSISLQNFKKDNLYGLQNAGIEKTIKNAQDFLLLQQLAEERKVDTMAYFTQKMGQKEGELREKYFFPQKMTDDALNHYVNANKTERNILVFSLQKAADDKTDYKKVYSDVTSGKLKMEDAIKTYVKKEILPVYIKPGLIPREIYDELSNMQTGGYTKLYDDPNSVIFAKLVNTRPSLGYMIFGTLAYPNDENAEKKKNEIIAALKSGKKFNEVTAQFGTTENELKNGGAVMGSPTMPDVIYNALKGKKKGEYTDQPVLFGDKYFFFGIYDLLPYQITETTKDFFKREMMSTNYASELENQLIENLKKSSAYKETADFVTAKKSYPSLQSLKNDNAVLFTYNKHKMDVGTLKKEINPQSADLQKITPEQWEMLLDMRRDDFVIKSYSADFTQIPEAKKELTDQKRMLYSEYIFSEFMKKEIENHPEWLTEYYNKNKSKYIWEERAEGRVAIVADDKLVSDVQKQIKNPANWEALKKKYDGQLNAKNQILVYFEEGKMSKEADVFVKNNVPFKKGVHSTKIGERTVVIAVDNIIPPTQMTQEEADNLLYDAVTEQKLKEITSSQRAKTKIVVEPGFIKDLESNFKK